MIRKLRNTQRLGMYKPKLSIDDLSINKPQYFNNKMYNINNSVRIVHECDKCSSSINMKNFYKV